jgi:hypothetical protein
MPSVRSVHSDYDDKKEQRDMTHDEQSTPLQDERMEALRKVRDADPGIKVLSRRGIQFLFYVLVVCMCTGDTGELSGCLLFCIVSDSWLRWNRDGIG